MVCPMTDKDTTPTAKLVKRASNPGRGSKPGEHRGGRVKGTPNKASQTLKELARQYTAEALEALVDVMRSETGTARVTAANAILDRGYGKPSTVLAGDVDGGAIRTVNEIILRGVEP